MAEKMKRKVVDENRKFQSELEGLYFVIQIKDKIICLICRDSISTLKSYNLKRHFEQKHSEIAELTVGERKAKLKLLKDNLGAQQSFLRKQHVQSNAIVSASIKISYIIAKKMKPFADGDYIKECLVAAVEEICPESPAFYSNQSSPSNFSKNFVYFSLALDETTNIKDTAQLAIFIRGVDRQMNVTEELLELVSLKDTTTGRDIKEAVINCMQVHQIDLKNLIGIAYRKKCWCSQLDSWPQRNLAKN
ncbi:general transcription factor II-I repeat domain-containing protein 2-like [Condylostylus longicornis]|uniref:general transcription factor II-I repeat domain-containing protein 2-like n=1 Tax=Condylostylus longicornis TaxID=2530218 RepID=UPI00244E1E9D|nr:general transcription factor II-I repeat domain-containing protein 2-like [Condylostylus longicornis]